jgi:hypothetical protein
MKPVKPAKPVKPVPQDGPYVKPVPQHKKYVDRYGNELGRLVGCPDCGGHLTLQWVHIPLKVGKQLVSLTADPLCIDIWDDRDERDPLLWADCDACKTGFALGVEDGEVAQALFQAGPAITGED